MPPTPLPSAFRGVWRARAQSIRIAALDLDDTLLTPGKEVSARTQAALEAWVSTGRQLILATGRPPRLAKAVPDFLRDVPMICYNGAWIETQGKVLYRNVIPAAAAQAFLRRILTRYPDQWLGLEAEDMLYEPRKARPQFESVVCDLRTVHKPAAKIILRPSQLEPGQEAWIRKALPPGCVWLGSVQYDIGQIMAPDTDKATALAWWLEANGLSFAQVVAVGDDTNDARMVACAATGVAMGNAVPEVQDAADFITADNRADGAARVLESIVASDAG